MPLLELGARGVLTQANPTTGSCRRRNDGGSVCSMTRSCLPTRAGGAGASATAGQYWAMHAPRCTIVGRDGPRDVPDRRAQPRTAPAVP